MSDKDNELNVETADSCSDNTSDLNTDLNTDDDNIFLLKLYQQIIDDSDLNKNFSHCEEIDDISFDHTKNENVLKQLNTDRISESVSDDHDSEIDSEINHNNNDRYDDINKNLISIYSIFNLIINESIININLKQLFLFSFSLFIIEDSSHLIHQETLIMSVSAQENAEDVLAIILIQILEKMKFDDHVNYFFSIIESTFLRVMTYIRVQIHTSKTAAEDSDHLDKNFNNLNLSDKNLLRICV